MKKFAPMIFAILLLAVSAFAQSRVKAEDILRSINEGRVVEYAGIEIIGDLDMTSIQDGAQDTGFWRFFGFSRDSRYHVRIPLIFRDCIFRGDVIAYRHDRLGRAAYNVSFHENVSFHGCEFMGKSAFKYAEFYRLADFTNATYHQEALFKYAEFFAEASFAGSNFFNGADFKYAKFSTETSFADSTFADEADFKYTRFPEAVDFTRVTFRDDVNFKYAKFPRGVSFRNSVFQGDADFKYTDFFEPFDFEGTEFQDSADFKYTKLEGKPFAPSVLNSRR